MGLLLICWWTLEGMEQNEGGQDWHEINKMKMIKKVVSIHTKMSYYEKNCISWGLNTVLRTKLLPKTWLCRANWFLSMFATSFSFRSCQLKEGTNNVSGINEKCSAAYPYIHMHVVCKKNVPFVLSTLFLLAWWWAQWNSSIQSILLYYIGAHWKKR